MKIIIVGAGEVGSHLAGLLSREHHDIVVIDHDPPKVARINERFDVLALEGNGASPTLLKEAGIQSADMMIAVTAVDEVNILACTIARNFGVETKIARVRNREFSAEAGFLNLKDLGIDQIIHPELECTREIVRLIRYPQVLELFTFCDGLIAIAGLKVTDESPYIGSNMIDLVRSISDYRFRIITITRNGQTIIPRGNDQLEANDIVYVAVEGDHLTDIFDMTGHTESETRHVMIDGAGLISRMVAQELGGDKKLHVKLIESDRQKAEDVAGSIATVMVVHGDASDIDLITQEGIIDQDVFLALTTDDESNIVTSLLARHLEVPKIITLVSKSEYIPIVKTIGLDITINMNILTSNAIFKYIHHSGIVSLRHLVGIDAETIEFRIGENSRVKNKQISDIKFPGGSIVVAIENDEGAKIPVGSTTIVEGDRVVVFCLPNAVKSVIKLFE